MIFLKKCHIRADLEASAVSLAMLHIIGLAPSMKSLCYGWFSARDEYTKICIL